MVIWSWEAPPELLWLLSKREEAKQAKRYAVADGIREALLSIGIDLIDLPTHTEWVWVVAVSITPWRD